jgi:glucokinase
VTERAVYLGVDVGRTSRIAFVDAEGTILELNTQPTDLTTGRALVDGLLEFVGDTTSRAAEFGRLGAIGIGFPGLVNHATHRVVMLPNLSDVSEIDVYGELRSASGLPVVVDNDANTAAYGEWTCGAAQGARDCICITMGTGIGAGLIQGGVLQRGAKGFAGEFGHSKIHIDGLDCSCGSAGCLETVASGPNIVRRARERLFTDPSYTYSPLAQQMRGTLTCDDLLEAARAGDSFARSIMAETGLYLGVAIANIVNLLNVEKVVLGGPVMHHCEYLLETVRVEAARRAFAPSFADCQIVASQLGDNAGVIGSAMLARDLGVR